MNTPDEVIDRLLDLALDCISRNDRPMPAIIARGGEIIAESQDHVISSRDPTQHGEMAAIREACAKLGQPHLRGCSLYSFGEPCIMCCGAIHWARLDSVTYCLSQNLLKSLSGGNQKPGIRDYLPLGRQSIVIVGPVREDEAFKIAKEYNWKSNAI